jgi:hypothetical protein
MSRILRRPMFRGGVTNNEGIMSVPRKRYNVGSTYDPAGTEEIFIPSIKSDNIPTGNQSAGLESIRKKNFEEGEDSYGDILMKEYLGNRPDPLGKFLINFGLNYMSATPKGGKFGALATAAESAKKPTEQLYSDIDTDRVLKLKLMTALQKSDSKVALEKEARLLVANKMYPDMQSALAALMEARLEQKGKSLQDKINDEYKAIRSQSVSSGSEIRDMNKAQILVRDKEKLGKDMEKLASTNTFGIPVDLSKIPNSNNFMIPKIKQEVIDKSYKVGRIYIDPDDRMSYEYMGKNTFRPIMKL